MEDEYAWTVLLIGRFILKGSPEYSLVGKNHRSPPGASVLRKTVSWLGPWRSGGNTSESVDCSEGVGEMQGNDIQPNART